jgi:tRNA threonylcarbamoyladenosine biosynthesis protein TsaE
MSDAAAFNLPLVSRRSTLHLARDLARCVCRGDLVILSGELGAGKTFLVRGLCRALGLPQRVRVTSPTFTLVHELDTVPPLLHVDLYRLSTSREVLELGLLEQRDTGRILIVEWGEGWLSELGGDALIIALSVHPRAARLSCCGTRSSKMLAQLRESGQMNIDNASKIMDL